MLNPLEGLVGRKRSLWPVQELFHIRQSIAFNLITFKLTCCQSDATLAKWRQKLKSVEVGVFGAMKLCYPPTIDRFCI